MIKAINLEKTIRLSHSNWLTAYAQKTAHDRYISAVVALENALKPINDVIMAVEGKATVRTLNGHKILLAIDRLEKKLNISKKSMIGITATIDIYAQIFPRAYKYTPMSTIFTVERRAAGWYITDLRRAECRRTEYTVTLSDSAKEAILENYARF